LARQILEAARQSKVSKELLTELCESAFDLAKASPSGHEVAIEAMTVLSATAPEKEAYCQRRILDGRIRQALQATGEKRALLGQECVDKLMALAEESEKKSDMASAIADLKTAEQVAGQIGSDTARVARTRIQKLELKGEAMKKASACEAKLKGRPEDRSAREALIQLYLVELDRPAEAGKYLQPDSDEVLRTYIPLASGDVEKLSADTSFELGQWYEGLAAKAGELGAPTALRRARTYYRRFLYAHEERDTKRIRVEVQLKKVEAALEKYEPKTGGDWYNVLRYFDIRQNVRWGVWLWDGSTLSLLRKGPYTRVSIPVVPDGSYELGVSFSRNEGEGATRIFLPVGQNSCAVVLGSGKEQTCSLERTQATGEAPALANTGRHAVYVKVTRVGTKAEVIVKLDNADLLTWSGSSSELSRGKEWSMADPLALGLGTHETRVTFHAMQLRMLSGRARSVAADESAARRAQIEEERRRLGTGTGSGTGVRRPPFTPPIGRRGF
jgi:hypothetical protein